MEKLTINELFSGIGAQRKALNNLGIEHDVVGISDIDKYANQSYEAIFGKIKNYGDISKVEKLDYADLWTYSFPCQDISVAGMQRGISENTRSGLLYEVQRLLEIAKAEDKLPKYLLLENVKNLVGKQFRPQFDKWIEYLDGLGYDTHWQVLNAKNYGIPQNRERVFGVSIRKDLNKSFKFPEKEELKTRLIDILESNVDESFYISDEKASRLFQQIANKEISNTIRTGGRGSLDRHTWDLVAEPLIAASRSGLKVFENVRIRRLTPLECWRLMGFDDEDFKKAKQSGVSNTQLYRQAGNSIVVKVLEKIFKSLLIE